MATLIATPNASNANSYLTVAEAQAYFDTRLPIAGWDDNADQEALLIMASRVLNFALAPRKRFVRPSKGELGYFITSRTWTGLPATTTQALSWGRIGMSDLNGNAIAPDVIPQELKNATAELAGALGTSDLTLDNDVVVQGIKSVKAGSVSVDFKDDVSVTKLLPDTVFDMLVPSWLTDEVFEYSPTAVFEVFT